MRRRPSRESEKGECTVRRLHPLRLVMTLVLVLAGSGSLASPTGHAASSASALAQGGPKPIPQPELEKLLHSARGRALMSSALGAAVVRALEKQYGIADDSSPVPAAPPKIGATTAARPISAPLSQAAPARPSQPSGAPAARSASGTRLLRAATGMQALLPASSRQADESGDPPETSLITETFTGAAVSSANQFAFEPVSSPTTGFPCLTAGSDTSEQPVPACSSTPDDSSGNGALRLTDNGDSEQAALVSTNAFPLSQGLDISFTVVMSNADQQSYGDGLSFDLAVPPADGSPISSVGAFGVQLGYSPTEISDGLPGGYLGFGFDETGDFTGDSSDGNGCVGPQAISDSVTVRGPGTGSSGYCELSTATWLSNLDDGSPHLVHIVIDPTPDQLHTNGTYAVYVDGQPMEQAGLPSSYYDASGTSYSGLPPLVSFVFAASTGPSGWASYHAVHDFAVNTLNGAVPVLGAEVSDSMGGHAWPGESFTYTITPTVSVQDETGPITLTDTYVASEAPPPDAITFSAPVSPDWNCSLYDGATEVVCVSAGQQSHPIGLMPPLTLTATVSSSVYVDSGTVDNITNRVLAWSSDGAGGVGGDELTVSGPVLGASVTDDATGGQVPYGYPVTYTITPTVSITDEASVPTVTSSFSDAYGQPDPISLRNPYVGPSWNCGASTSSGLNCTWRGSTPIAVGELAPITVIGMVSDTAALEGDVITNTVTVSSNDGTSGEGSDEVTVASPPDSSATATAAANQTATAAANATSTAAANETAAAAANATSTAVANQTATAAANATGTAAANQTATAAANATSTAAANETATAAANVTSTAVANKTATAAANQTATAAANQTATAAANATSTAVANKTATAAANQTATAAANKPASTATSTATATATATATPYHYVTEGLTFDGDVPVGNTVTNVHVTLPSYLGSGGVLRLPSMSIGANLAPSLPVTLPAFNFQRADLTVTAPASVLSSSGLAVSNASLTLPSTLGGVSMTGSIIVGATALSGTLSASNVSLSAFGMSVTAGSISLDVSLGGQTSGSFAITNAAFTLPGSLGGATVVGNLAASYSAGTPSFSGSLTASNTFLTLAGFTLAVQEITLDSSGLAVTGVSLTLPTRFEVNGRAVTLTGGFTVTQAAGKWTVTGSLTAPASSLQAFGFALSFQSLTLNTSGMSVTGVSLTLPSSFDVNDHAVTISGSLGLTDVNGTWSITGSLSMGQASLSLLGFTVAVQGITLDSSGLTITGPSLTLPTKLATFLGTSTLSLTVVTISAGFTVTAQSNGLTFHIAGATIASGPITVGTAGLSMTQASITLPSELGGSTFTLPAINMAASSTSDTSVPVSKPITFKFADMSLSATGFTLSSAGISIGQLTVSLPIFKDSLTLQGLSFDGHSISITGGGADITLPEIDAGGFEFDATASIMFTDSSGSVSYDFAASATVAMKGIGEMSCSLELGTPDATHPSELRSAEMDIQVDGAGIPIYGTPLEINGLSGGIQIGAKYDSQGNPIPGQVIYTFHLGIHLQTDDDGFTYNGDATAAFSSDGNFGLGTQDSELFKFFDIKGGICVRLVAQPDGVCTVVLPTHGSTIDNSVSTGFYAEISVGKDFDIRQGKTISIEGDAYAHIWVDSDGPEIAATASIDVDVPTSSIAPLIPPCGLSAEADAAIGKFIDSDNGDKYFGVKAGVQVDICKISFGLHVLVYLDNGVHLKWKNLDGYTLYDTANTPLTLLPVLGALAPAAASWRPVLRAADLSGANAAPNLPILSDQVVYAPSSLPSVTTKVQILPNESEAVFVLAWKAGSPSFSLAAPDGTTYAPAAGSLVTGDLGDGYVGGYQIAVPNPQAGAWTANVGNLTGDEAYEMTMYYPNPVLPTLTVDTPMTGTALLANPTVALSGHLTGDQSAGNTVSLYYATAPNTANGTAFATRVPVVDGAWQYAWNAASVPAGTYYVYAMLDDGVGPNIIAYAGGSVRVIQPAQPDAPRNVVATDYDGHLALLWAPPAHAGLVAGYDIYWRHSDWPAGKWEVAYAPATATSASLPETLRGVTYQASVSAYDVEGHESARAAAQRLPLVSFGAKFRIQAASGRVRRGGSANIALKVTPLGAAWHCASDYVTLSLGKGSPKGITASTVHGPVSLFAANHTATLHVVVGKSVASKTYHLVVQVTQQVTGRVVSVPFTLTVTK